MNGKLQLLALFLILPLLTFAIMSVQEADADKGDKSCAKKSKDMKSSSYTKSSKLSDKMSKKQQF